MNNLNRFFIKIRSPSFPIRRCKSSKQFPKSCYGNSKMPTKILNSGHEIPLIGLGTWGSAEEQVEGAVTVAINAGYRMIDTAFVYENEKFVGNAMQQMIKDKVVKRQDLFITTKLWNTYHRPDLVVQACRMSLRDLKVNYLDLYLMHWPTAYLEGNKLFPRDSCGNIKFSPIDYIETWKAMEKLQEMGLTKSIGISNFNRSQISRLLKSAKIHPAVLQCECHPFLNQNKLMKYCESKNIAFMAYSPLGSSKSRPYAVKGEERLLETKIILNIAELYKKTPAQILIRYQIQRDNLVIPKSVNKLRIESNFQVFNWKISDDHMQILDNMDKNQRYVNKIEEAGKHKYYPFWDEY